MPRGIFVTGTDTGVGKTVIGSGIAAAARRRGIDVGVLKPVSAGGRQDAEVLARAAGVEDPLDDNNPVALRLPLSPDIAAALDGATVDVDALRASCRARLAAHLWTIVEGAGGLLVPLTTNEDMADLAVALGLPVVVVSRAALGTINHTRLTVECARSRGLHVIGIIYNTLAPGVPGHAATESPSVVERRTGVPSLGTVPFLNHIRFDSEFDALADAIEQHVDLSLLFTDL